MRRTIPILLSAYLFVLAAVLCANLLRTERSLSSTSIEALRAEIASAQASAKNIAEVHNDERRIATLAETVNEKVQALEHQLIALEVLSSNAQAHFERLEGREEAATTQNLTIFFWLLCSVASCYMVWNGLIRHRLMVNEGRGLLASFLQRRVLLTTGFKLPRESKAEERHALLKQAGFVRWHLDAAAQILSDLTKKVPVQGESDASKLVTLLDVCETIFQDLGIRSEDPFETEWSNLGVAERTFQKQQAEGHKQLQEARVTLEQEVASRLAKALAAQDLKSREAAKLAEKAEVAAAARRDEATRALDELQRERNAFASERSKAEGELASADVKQRAAHREHEQAEALRREVANKEAGIQLILNQLEACAEFAADRILAEMERCPKVREQILQWIKLVHEPSAA